MIAHGHYSAIFNPGGRFDDTPPSANLSGYDYVDQQFAYWMCAASREADPAPARS